MRSVILYRFENYGTVNTKTMNEVGSPRGLGRRVTHGSPEGPKIPFLNDQNKEIYGMKLHENSMWQIFLFFSMFKGLSGLIHKNSMPPPYWGEAKLYMKINTKRGGII